MNETSAAKASSSSAPETVSRQVSSIRMSRPTMPRTLFELAVCNVRQFSRTMVAANRRARSSMALAGRAWMPYGSGQEKRVLGET